MLTGCRLSEILTLRWDDVDGVAGEFRLRDGKTGARMVPLTPTAQTVLAGIARVSGNPWVIVGKKPGARLSTMTGDWYRLRAQAGLDDVHIHDLRHSYASRALAMGESLSMIGKLLGHTDIKPGFPIWNPPSPLSVARNRSTCNSPSNDGHLRADPDD